MFILIILHLVTILIVHLYLHLDGWFDVCFKVLHGHPGNLLVLILLLHEVLVRRAELREEVHTLRLDEADDLVLVVFVIVIHEEVDSALFLFTLLFDFLIGRQRR